jgi:hypothetical protein
METTARPLPDCYPTAPGIAISTPRR